MNTLKMAVLTVTVCLSVSIQGRADSSITVTPDDDIQNIIDNCGDSESNQVTIYFQSGNYDSFSAISNIAQSPRFISLIGVGDVTVENTSGCYDSPAAELRLNGTVDNIKFVSSHPEEEINLSDKGAYAVHADYGSMHTVFNDCAFISYQTAGVGMGLTHNSEVTFNNCRFENRANKSFGSGYNLGALYVHSGLMGENISGAKLNINKCILHFPEESYKSIVIQELNGNDIEVNIT